MKDREEFRPIKISQIKNNSVRRLLMIILFIPIVVTGWVKMIGTVVLWIVPGIFIIPYGLLKSGIKYWSVPRDGV